MDKFVPLFIICTAVAVIIQAGILVALFVVVRKTTSRVEALSGEISTKALPAIDTVQQALVSLRPRIEDIVLTSRARLAWRADKWSGSTRP